LILNASKESALAAVNLN